MTKEYFKVVRCYYLWNCYFSDYHTNEILQVTTISAGDVMKNNFWFDDCIAGNAYKAEGELKKSTVISTVRNILSGNFYLQSFCPQRAVESFPQHTSPSSYSRCCPATEKETKKKNKMCVVPHFHLKRKKLLVTVHIFPCTKEFLTVPGVFVFASMHVRWFPSPCSLVQTCR